MDSIIITDVSYHNVEGPRVEILSKPYVPAYYPGHGYADTSSYSSETVVTVNFVDSNGQERRIGMTDKVKDILGDPFKCVTDRDHQIDRLEKELSSEKTSSKLMRSTLAKAELKCRSLTFRQRVKVLFGTNPLTVK